MAGRLSRYAATVLVAASCLIILFATSATAQLARVGSSHLVDSVDFVMGADAAYDPVHQMYLVVQAREHTGTGGSVWGVFVDAAGVPAPSAFLIHSGGRANFARATYSPHVSDGAGGQGGFLVTWSEPLTPGSFARIVSYPNRLVTPPRALSTDYGLREVSYSPASQMFLAAWENAAPDSAFFRRVALDAATIGDPIPLAAGNAGRPWIIWNSITAVAWHATSNEFGVLYAVQEASVWFVRLARVSTAGDILDRHTLAQMSAEPIAAALQYSPLTGNYIALWAGPAAGAITGAEVSGAGDVISTGPIPRTLVAGENGMALAYSGGSGTFLLLGYGAIGAGVAQVKGLELNKHGAPHSAVIDATAFPLTTNYFAPRAAGRSDAPEWLVTAGAPDRYTQVVSSSSLFGGSDLRLGGCSTPDPFVALGGGTCYDGNWLPPGMAPPAPLGATPPPTPPPPAPTGCATPDPFTALGGGTCYDGNWLPPGIAPPAPPAPPDTTPPPPTPLPPASTGCATPDPFTVLGGGTCYDGNWLPPGIPPPASPGTTPPPAPPPSAATGCVTPDPFTALGGGTCYNGNWLPPGMPPPGAPEPPSPPPSTPDGCVTPDPFVSLGGGSCVNGGWLPPGMYLIGNGILGPNPDPLFPPPPQSTGDCATPDPYLNTVGGIGVCVNGVWQLVGGAHSAGTVFVIDGILLLRENVSGLVYTPLNGMPAGFRTVGTPVYFEGMLRLDILHTFPAPILQLRTLVAQ